MICPQRCFRKSDAMFCSAIYIVPVNVHLENIGVELFENK
jgi:hypothetical protein